MHRQHILPDYPVSGVLNSYTRAGDSLFAQLTNDKFTGKLKYYTKSTFYEMNFNEKGQAHDPSFISLGEMCKLMRYEHFTNNERSGHYFLISAMAKFISRVYIVKITE